MYYNLILDITHENFKNFIDTIINEASNVSQFLRFSEYVYHKEDFSVLIFYTELSPEDKETQNIIAQLFNDAKGVIRNLNFLNCHIDFEESIKNNINRREYIENLFSIYLQ